MKSASKFKGVSPAGLAWFWAYQAQKRAAVRTQAQDRSGYLGLFRVQLMQTDSGCYFDFPHGVREAGIPWVLI